MQRMPQQNRPAPPPASPAPTPAPANPPAPMLARGASCAREARQAIAELAAQLQLPDPALTLFFCTADYPLPAVAAAAREHFADGAVLGCSAAGIITPQGEYAASGISGVALSRRAVTVTCGLMNDVHEDAAWKGRKLAQHLRAELITRAGAIDFDNSFACMLVDGLCYAEERVVSGIASALGGISLCGGSAGDDLAFERSHVYHGGRFHRDAAVLALVRSRLPFRVFSSHHFAGGERRIVVTRADPERRLVYEFDGEPAAEVYARLVGTTVDELQYGFFVSRTFVTRIGDSHYVRSIEELDRSGALKFACAIEEGMVLRVARRLDPAQTLARNFNDVRAVLGDIDLALGFDCAYNRAELADSADMPGVSAEFRRNKLVGFSSFGEQIDAMHVNQTLTGVAFAVDAGATGVRTGDGRNGER